MFSRPSLCAAAAMAMALAASAQVLGPRSMAASAEDMPMASSAGDGVSSAVPAFVPSNKAVAAPELTTYIWSTTIFPSTTLQPTALATSFIDALTDVPAAGPSTISAMVPPAMTPFPASVVGGDSCDTTLALVCTDTTRGGICEGTGAKTVKMTLGPTAFNWGYETSFMGTSIASTESCDLYGVYSSPTSAVCRLRSTSINPTLTTSGVAIETIVGGMDNVPLTITAGANKLPAASQTCTKEPKHGAAVPKSIPEVYRVLVPVGAALVAGAGAML